MRHRHRGHALRRRYGRASKRALPAGATRFRDLAIGDTFDFIDPNGYAVGSFHSRCTKISPRSYSWQIRDMAHLGDDKPLKTLTTKVGTGNVAVYHVGRT